MRPNTCPHCNLVYIGNDIPETNCPGCGGDWPREKALAQARVLPLPARESTPSPPVQQIQADAVRRGGLLFLAFVTGAMLMFGIVYSQRARLVNVEHSSAYQQLHTAHTGTSEQLAKTELRLQAIGEQLAEVTTELDQQSARYTQDVGDVAALRARLQQLEQENFGLRLANAKSFVRSWLLLGPFPNPETEPAILAVTTPRETQELAGHAWKTLESNEDRIKLDQFYNERNPALCYCVCWAYSDIERDVQLSVGSDDAIYVWVNGAQVHANPNNRSASPDQDKVNAHLNAGWNRIMTRIDNLGAGDWAMFFEFRSREATPLKIFSTSQAPPDPKQL